MRVPVAKVDAALQLLEPSKAWAWFTQRAASGENEALSRLVAATEASRPTEKSGNATRPPGEVGDTRNPGMGVRGGDRDVDLRSAGRATSSWAAYRGSGSPCMGSPGLTDEGVLCIVLAPRARCSVLSMSASIASIDALSTAAAVESRDTTRL
jgi:hypothetical protein